MSIMIEDVKCPFCGSYTKNVSKLCEYVCCQKCFRKITLGMNIRKRILRFLTKIGNIFVSTILIVLGAIIGIVIIMIPFLLMGLGIIIGVLLGLKIFGII